MAIVGNDEEIHLERSVRREGGIWDWRNWRNWWGKRGCLIWGSGGVAWLNKLRLIGTWENEEDDELRFVALGMSSVAKGSDDAGDMERSMAPEKGIRIPTRPFSWPFSWSAELGVCRVVRLSVRRLRRPRVETYGPGSAPGDHASGTSEQATRPPSRSLDSFPFPPDRLYPVTLTQTDPKVSPRAERVYYLGRKEGRKEMIVILIMSWNPRSALVPCSARLAPRPARSAMPHQSP